MFLVLLVGLSYLKSNERISIIVSPEVCLSQGTIVLILDDPHYDADAGSALRFNTVIYVLYQNTFNL